MDDKDKANGTNVSVPFDHLTSKTKRLDALSAQLKQDAHVSWTRRVLSWFKRG